MLGIQPDDRCLSAAKAFFAYGLGNSVLFPLSVGAAAILEPAPSRPEILAERAAQIRRHLVLRRPDLLRQHAPREPARAPRWPAIRLAASAGEALPAALYERWTSHFGVDILDGIGMTEMLHIFLSNIEGQVRPGTTGVAVPGYELKILDEAGAPARAGTPGTLYVRGASAATGYWSRYDASRRCSRVPGCAPATPTFSDADGYYTCLGRSGDMLRVSDMWVSPSRGRGTAAGPPGGRTGRGGGGTMDGLEKPVAYVITSSPGGGRDELIDFCRAGLPSYQRPRKVLFVAGYPVPRPAKSAAWSCARWLRTCLVVGRSPGKRASPGEPGRRGYFPAGSGRAAADQPDGGGDEQH